MDENKSYTVKELACISGVTVRTLHYYDKQGLLAPSSRTAAGYRQYKEENLLRLQQILFYRELDFSLREIKEILNHRDFDPLKALKEHRKLICNKAGRLKGILNTIDKTISKLEGENIMLTDKELYEGFSKEKVERYKKEIKEKYDPKLVAESNRRIGKMSKEQWQALKREGEELTAQVAELSDRSPGEPEVQALIKKHFAYMNNFYTVTKEIYRGLGEMYVENPEFTVYYEKFKPGLAEFIRKAITFFCDRAE